MRDPWSYGAPSLTDAKFKSNQTFSKVIRLGQKLPNVFTDKNNMNNMNIFKIFIYVISRIDGKVDERKRRSKRQSECNF